MSTEKYEPELGQMIFGQPHKEFSCSNLVYAALSAISEELTRIMRNIEQREPLSPFANTGQQWKCDVFEVQAYSWNEDIEQPYNFKWRDIEISWYKYLGRGMSCNRPIQPNEIRDMLDECLDALHKYEKEHDANSHK